MGVCLSCIRPQDEEDLNSETQPLLQSEQVLQQKQRDLVEREEQYRTNRINELEKIINSTREVLIDSNNIYLEQSYSSISNGNLPKVVKRIQDETELDGEEIVEANIKNAGISPLFVNIDKALTTI